MGIRQNVTTAIVAVGLTASTFFVPALSTDETTGGKMSTAATQDIINSMRERGSFHKMLDGMELAFALDNKLKGKGPFTVFACEDKGWGKLNQADQDTLFNNKKKMAQVFSYEIVEGQALDSHALEALSSIKSMEGHEIKLSKRNDSGKIKGSLYVDNARVKTADIHCTNGILYITEVPIMPQLAQ